MGRFINADAFASTGQGLLGNNMFAYCNNNPVVSFDNTGTRMEYVGNDFGGPAGFPSPGTISNVIPPSAKGKKITLPLEFTLIEETSLVRNGTKKASLLSCEFDMYNFDDSGFNLLSFSLSSVSLDLLTSNWEHSYFDLGNVSASVGMGLIPYASVLVSIWSPSVTCSIGNKDVSVALHVGALGAGYNFTSSEFQATFSNGIGFSLGIT